MSDALRRRIAERLEGLPEDKLLQVLDYVAFLESRYNQSELGRSTLDRIVSGVEDTLRVGRAPVVAFKGTVGAIDAAGRVMRGLAAAGRAILDEAQVQASGAGSEDAAGTAPAKAGQGPAAKKA